MAGSEKDIASRFKRSDHYEAYLRLIKWELDDELAMTEERLRNCRIRSSRLMELLFLV